MFRKIVEFHYLLSGSVFALFNFIQPGVDERNVYLLCRRKKQLRARRSCVLWNLQTAVNFDYQNTKQTLLKETCRGLRQLCHPWSPGVPHGRLEGSAHKYQMCNISVLVDPTRNIHRTKKLRFVVFYTLSSLS